MRYLFGGYGTPNVLSCMAWGNPQAGRMRVPSQPGQTPCE
jgi:hypothetical protein